VRAVTDYRPNSGIRAQNPMIWGLTLIISLYWNILRYNVPRFFGMNQDHSKTARLRSYINWPHGMNPSSEPRAQLDYFTHVRWKILEITTTHFYKITLSYRSWCHNKMFSLWRRTDDSWREHALWFPYCVYVRCIFIRDCRSLQTQRMIMAQLLFYTYLKTSLTWHILRIISSFL